MNIYLINMIFHFLKCGWRSLLRYRTQSLISIACLSVGLLCFGLCMYVVRYLHAFDENFPNYDRMYEVKLQNVDKPDDMLLPPLYSVIPDLQLHTFSQIEHYTMVSNNTSLIDVTVEDQGEMATPYEGISLDIDSNFTDLFKIAFVYGNLQSAFAQPNSVLLSRSMALKMFGNRNPVGERLNRLSTYESVVYEDSYTVTGVLEDIPRNNPFSTETPIDIYLYREASSMDMEDVYALCAPDTDAEVLNKQMAELNITVDMFGRSNRPVFVLAEQLHPKISPYQKTLSSILAAIGLLALLVALLNFYLFTVGQFFNRLREIEIRKSLGSNGYHQFGLLFTEQLITLSATLLITLCLVEWIYPDGQLALGKITFPISKIQLSLQLVQYLFILLAISAVICLYVVWKCNRIDTQTALKGGNRYRVRNAILALQLFISILFLGGGAVLQMQNQKLAREIYASLTPSEKKQIIKLDLSHAYMKPYRQLMVDELKKSTAVKDVLAMDYHAVSSLQSWISTTPNSKESETILLTLADYNYASFFNIPLLRGRIPQAPNEVLVNTALLQKLGQGLGSTIYKNRSEACIIVGEVGDVAKDCFALPISGSMVAAPPENNDWTYLYVKCNDGQMAEVKELIRKVGSQFLPPHYAIPSVSFQNEIEQSYTVDKTLAQLITLLAMICLVITLLGIYSAITLDTERRQKEVAIRKINGAGQACLILLFGRFYLTLVGITLLLAIPVIYIANQQWFKYYVTAVSLDGWFFLALALFMLLFVGSTVIFRILRIIRLNPAEIIKTE